MSPSTQATHARRAARGAATSGNVELSLQWLTDREGAAERCIAALKATDWNVEKAAEKLNVGRRTLYRWMKKYKIKAPKGATRRG